MKDYSLKYDTSEIVFHVPDKVFSLVRPPVPAVSHSLNRDVDQALSSPVNCAPLHQFLSDKHRILWVISDATRKTGSEVVLPIVREHLARAGFDFRKEMRFIVSTGIHRAPTREEMFRLAGSGVFPEAEVEAHDACDESALDDWGVTSFGNRVLLNRAVKWADAIVVAGAVGFHYFAGFSGGRKSIMPGLAGLSTIHFNHSLAIRPDGGGRRGESAVASLDRNPVHLDMVEVLRLVSTHKMFCINTLTSSDDRVTGVVCGHVEDSHRLACRRYQDAHSVLIPGKADIVVGSAGGFPRDINMVQSHKPVEMARYGLKEGGVMVMAAACREGMGHDSFFPWFRFDSVEEFGKELARNYVINGQTALSLFEKTRKYRIILVSRLSPEEVCRMGMTPARDPDEAMGLALEGLPRNATGYVLPEAGTTLMETGR